MKDYIRKVSNEEIAGWIVDYLAEIGWGLNNPYKNLQNVEDLYIDRCKGNFVATLYFDHPHKEYSHQETVYNHPLSFFHRYQEVWFLLRDNLNNSVYPS